MIWSGRSFVKDRSLFHRGNVQNPYFDIDGALKDSNVIIDEQKYEYKTIILYKSMYSMISDGMVTNLLPLQGEKQIVDVFQRLVPWDAQFLKSFTDSGKK